MSTQVNSAPRSFSDFKAVIFDMDGVITDTADAHAGAWKELFDEYLSARGELDGIDYGTFDRRQDYRRYVDGKARYDGVRSFLESRDIDLLFGEVDDRPDEETICGLGNRKNVKFNEWLDKNQVRAYPSTIHLIKQLRNLQIRVGAFSASRNCRAVLASAGVLELFDAIVDGEDAARLALAGKPDPAMLFRTAEMLRADPSDTIVVEDAMAGVEAGVAGGFHTVIGIDRGAYGAELEAHGADAVVRDLAEFKAAHGCLVLKTIATLPSAWTERSQIAAKLANRQVAVFLDYDGTLTPIVSDYRAAFLSEEMRQAVANLAAATPVAVISGRGLADVRELVALEQLYYAGSHGFELSGPGGFDMVEPRVEGYLENLDLAQQALHSRLDEIEGSAVERKRFTIAVHYRNVAEEQVQAVKHAVDKVLGEVPHLRKGGGKKVLELKPDLDWDKGAAVDELCSALELDTEETSVVYIGDDLTDEDAFRVTVADSIGIIVRDQDRDRQTAADYVLEDTHEVGMFLQWLADQLGKKK